MNGTDGMVEIAPGIHRLTQRLPLGIDHVHCYLLRTDDGYLLVDTGLGMPGVEAWWAAALARLDAPVTRVVVTHMHPDHAGGARVVSALTGAPVLEGRLDHAQCVQVWGDEAWLDRVDEWFRLHGMPEELEAAARVDAEELRAQIGFPPAPEPLEPGDRVAGWEAVPLPGHADGQLGLLRDGVLVAGDALLPDITPIVGLYPESRPDPLADFVASLRRVQALAPRLALPGHGEPIADPGGRADELIAHHRERLDLARAALSAPRTAYEVSRALWAQDFPAALRRMAVAETLSHLERLRAEGRAERREDVRAVTYTGA